METTQISVKGRMVKQIVLYPYEGILFSSGKRCTDTNTNKGNLENTVLSKRSQSEATSFMAPFIQNVWGRQTCRQRKELSGYLGLSGIV